MQKTNKNLQKHIEKSVKIELYYVTDGLKSLKIGLKYEKIAKNHQKSD